MPFLPRLTSDWTRFAVRATSFGLACLAFAEFGHSAPPGTPRKPTATARQLDPTEEFPIPTPDRSVFGESNLNVETSPQKPTTLKNESRSQNVTNEQPVDATQTPDKGLMPDEAVSLKPDSNVFTPASAGNAPTKEELTFPLAEIFSLRSVEQIGKTKQVIANREGFITVLAAARDGILPKPADNVRIVSRKLGTVDLTVIGETGVKTYRLKITPSVAQLETLIAKQFPLSSVEVTAAGDHILVVEGTVETPGDVEGILTLLQSFVGTKGKIINGIKVAGVSQVQLEVVIARVDRTEAKRLGVNFEFAGKGGFGGSQIGNAGGVTAIAPAMSGIAGAGASVVPPMGGMNPIFVPGIPAVPSSGNAFQNLGGAAVTAITPASTLFVGVTHELQQFMAQLEFLKRNNVVKVLARPTLITLTGRPAEFLVGGEQPFPYQVSAIAQPSVDFKKFGTRLNFLPVILGPNKIRLDLVPEFSTVDENSAVNIGGISVPRFITQRIHTVVEMEPGQTLVLGGLLQTETASQVEKVPYLGDLPYAGAAFRKVTSVERELELIVIVTPRLVHPLDGSEGPVSLPGEESRSPTDKELFFHGLPEAPHCPNPNLPGYSQGSIGNSKLSRPTTADSTKSTVQPVAAQTQVKTAAKPKSWLRFPSVLRRAEKSPSANTSPSLVVQRPTTPKTTKSTTER